MATIAGCTEVDLWQDDAFHMAFEPNDDIVTSQVSATIKWELLSIVLSGGRLVISEG